MKRFKFIVFLSALLCVAMMFAACGDVEDDGNVTPEAPEQTREELADITKKIAKYLEYYGDENGKAIELAFEFGDSKQSESMISRFYDSSDNLSDYVAVIKTTTTTLLPDGITVDTMSDRYVVKNVATGNTVYENTTGSYRPGVTPGVKYRFRTLANIILEVAREEVIYDSEGNASYNYSYEYRTLDANSLARISGIDSGVSEILNYNGDYEVSIDGKTYIVRDDEIIYQFTEGVERTLPEGRGGKREIRYTETVR